MFTIFQTCFIVRGFIDAEVIGKMGTPRHRKMVMRLRNPLGALRMPVFPGCKGRNTWVEN
jgi:hypothetical protein